MAGTHRIHIDVFSAVQLSERPNYGWILAPQEKKFTIIFEWQEYIEYIDVFMQFISLSLKQQNLGEILHPKKKKFTLIFDWQEYIRTHRCLFCSSSHPETTDYTWIFAPQKKTTGKLLAPPKKKKKQKKITLIFRGRNTLNLHWYLSAVHLSLKQQITGEFLQHTKNEVHRHLWVTRIHFSESKNYHYD